MSEEQTATAMAADGELIRRTLQGDNGAFGELVWKYKDRLYNSVLRITRCSTDADDIVQDAFVRAFATLKDFRQDCAFFTWLYRLAMNEAISQIRERRRTVSLDASREFGFCEPVNREELPLDSLMREERAPAIAAALAKLNEQYRTVLLLREIERFDYATIARVLDLNVGTVRSRLHRARMQMRRLLNMAV